MGWDWRAQNLFSDISIHEPSWTWMKHLLLFFHFISQHLSIFTSQLCTSLNWLVKSTRSFLWPLKNGDHDKEGNEAKLTRKALSSLYWFSEQIILVLYVLLCWSVTLINNQDLKSWLEPTHCVHVCVLGLAKYPGALYKNCDSFVGFSNSLHSVYRSTHCRNWDKHFFSSSQTQQKHKCHVFKGILGFPAPCSFIFFLKIKISLFFLQEKKRYVEDLETPDILSPVWKSSLGRMN